MIQKNKLTIILIVISAILLFLFYDTYNKLKLERKNREFYIKQTEQNIRALKDSISVEFNKKLEAFEFSKNNLLLDKLSDLEKYNKELYNELENVKGEVIGAIKAEVEVDLGGITTSNELEIINSDLNFYGLKFSNNYKDQGFEQKLSGISKFYITPDFDTKTWNIKPDITAIDTNLMRLNITYGFRELDDQYQVFAISPSPKVQLNDLTGGYFIDKQPTLPYIPKKWGIGPYVGFGINTGLNSKSVSLGWSVGMSVHYDFIQF